MATALKHCDGKGYGVVSAARGDEGKLEQTEGPPDAVSPPQ